MTNEPKYQSAHDVLRHYVPNYTRAQRPDDSDTTHNRSTAVVDALIEDFTQSISTQKASPRS